MKSWNIKDAYIYANNTSGVSSPSSMFGTPFYDIPGGFNKFVKAILQATWPFSYPANEYFYNFLNKGYVARVHENRMRIYKSKFQDVQDGILPEE
ncbi:MAG: hypothetical protein HON90_02125 [Halobacteriovoraceae bacterium]|nr:hypothetical protein [Halobacteriovoraceae bacterium]